MERKPYRAEALDMLRRFLEEARTAGPATAYTVLDALAAADAGRRVSPRP